MSNRPALHDGSTAALPGGQGEYSMYGVRWQEALGGPSWVRQTRPVLYRSRAGRGMDWFCVRPRVCWLDSETGPVGVRVRATSALTLAPHRRGGKAHDWNVSGKSWRSEKRCCSTSAASLPSTRGSTREKCVCARSATSSSDKPNSRSPSRHCSGPVLPKRSLKSPVQATIASELPACLALTRT
jgi:hypothetical protein